MPQYAYFDATAPAPQPVIGWFDTDSRSYPVMPPAAELLALTASQWQGRLADPSGWAVQNGALVAAPAVVQPPSVPQQVTMVQGALAMHAQPGSAPGKTLLDDVEAAVAAASDPRIAIAWSKATTLDRHGLFVVQMAPALGLTDDKLDALFVAASGISV